MQSHISKYLLFFILLSNTLLGCTICTIYSPETNVSIEVKANETKIENASIRWVLPKDFTNELTLIYDTNQNQYLDKKELEPIQQSILDYVVPRDFLAHISYAKTVNKEKSKKINVKEYKTYIKNSRLHFEYLIKLNYDVIKDNALYIKINDKEDFFILKLVKNGVKFDAPFKAEQLQERQSVIFHIDPALVVESKKQKEADKKLDKIELNEESKDAKEDESLIAGFSKKVKEYLLKIESGDDYALFILLGVSFIYGIIHALGPGHGKSLAFTYFSSSKSSIYKAFIVSQASAFIHILGALILVIVSVFVLESFLNNFVKDSVKLLTQTSAIMIILLAIYILYRKLTNKGCATCGSHHHHSHEHTHENSAFSANNLENNLKPASTFRQASNFKQEHKSEVKEESKDSFMKSDLYFVLTAGLIPCPGTVVLFIYAFVLKTYFAVFLASIAISLGMGTIIFASSFLGLSLHRLSEKSHNLTNILEIAAPLVMAVLGVLLFISANSI